MNGSFITIVDFALCLMNALELAGFLRLRFGNPLKALGQAARYSSLKFGVGSITLS